MKTRVPRNPHCICASRTTDYELKIDASTRDTPTASDGVQHSKTMGLVRCNTVKHGSRDTPTASVRSRGVGGSGRGYNSLLKPAGGCLKSKHELSLSVLPIAHGTPGSQDALCCASASCDTATASVAVQGYAVRVRSGANLCEVGLGSGVQSSSVGVGSKVIYWSWEWGAAFEK